MMRYYVRTVLALVLCGWFIGCDSEPDETSTFERDRQTLRINNVTVSHDHLTFDYEIQNDSQHDIWICDDMYLYSDEKVETHIKRGIVYIRLRYNFQADFVCDTMFAQYVRLSPDAQYKATISLKLPIGERPSAYDSEKADIYAVAEVDHAIFEVGYFPSDLKRQISRYMKKAKRKFMRSDYVYDSAVTLRKLNQQRDMNNVISIQYWWEGMKGERVLAADINGIRIPYYTTNKD